MKNVGLPRPLLYSQHKKESAVAVPELKEIIKGAFAEKHCDRFIGQFSLRLAALLRG